MSAGRKPKPTHLRILEGNPGKRALPRAEPKPKTAAPACPRFLTGEARKEWRRMVALLLPLGLLTQVDRAALAAYCQCWARWVYAEEQLAILRDLPRPPLAEGEPALPPPGWTFTTDKGYEGITPWLSIANAALKEMRAFLAEFGMTPSSRSRVTASKPETSDPYEAFRAQRTGTGE